MILKMMETMKDLSEEVKDLRSERRRKVKETESSQASDYSVVSMPKGKCRMAQALNILS